ATRPTSRPARSEPPGKPSTRIRSGLAGYRDPIQEHSINIINSLHNSIVLPYTRRVATRLLKWRTALDSALTEAKKSFYALRRRVKRGLWYSRDGWSCLTSGMEIEELWAQFKTEASESSRPYQQDVSDGAGKRERSWKRSIKILQTLVWSVLRKLSPARRLFLLLTMILAFLSVVGFHFLLLTQELEFGLAFLGLLILLVLVLGDHISM